MRARKDVQPCYIARARGRTLARPHAAMRGFSRYRSLLVRALRLCGCSEKQRMFQTYHAAPDDEAAARAA